MAEEAGPEMAVVDMQLQGIDGLEVLKRLREASPGTEVIMATATAHASVASAVEAMKRGAFDYLNKPLDLEEVRVVVDKALAHLRLSRELSHLKARGQTGARASEIVGESPAIRALKEQGRSDRRPRVSRGRKRAERGDGQGVGGARDSLWEPENLRAVRGTV